MTERELEKPKAYDTLPMWVKDPLQALAMRAILTQVQKSGLPKSFLIDVAQSFHLIGDYRIDRFVYCLYECGAVLFAPLTLSGIRQRNSFKSYVNTIGKESSCLWFTFNVRDVRNGEQVNPLTGEPEWDDYNQPQLRPCTQEEARVYLDKLYEESTDT